jgi:hypothetical protein
MIHKPVNIKYFAQFFSECEMFWTNAVETIGTHILRSLKFFFFFFSVYDNDGKYCTAGQATVDNIKRRMCFIPNATNTHSEYRSLTATVA